VGQKLVLTFLVCLRYDPANELSEEVIRGGEKNGVISTKKEEVVSVAQEKKGRGRGIWLARRRK